MSTKKIKKNILQNQILYVGMDVHKTTWTITVMKNKAVFMKKTIDSKVDVLLKVLKRKFPGADFKFAYEAGFSGFGLQRKLNKLGYECVVVNPPDIPSNQKQEVYKDDAIDSKTLAYQLELGSLESIYIPTKKEEGLKNLYRYRVSLKKKQVRVKNQTKAMLFKCGVDIPEDKKNKKWSKSYIRWLETIEFDSPGNQIVFNGYIEEIKWLDKKLRSLWKKVKNYITSDTYLNRTFQLLCSVPGIGPLTAFALLAELYNMDRFGNEDKLCCYVGLIPMTESSGEKEKSKGITFRQKKHLRCILIEASWIAIRTDPVLMDCFLRHCKNMKKSKAIIRVAKKLLRRIKRVWQTREEYVTGVVE